MIRKRVVSGIQSSGHIHLGNYMGAIKNWVNMQNQYDCIYFLADLHAITTPQNPDDLKQSIYNQAACLLAAGIDSSKSIIFPQSSVKEHAELAWILTCSTPMGWLKRMTQFKDKSNKNQDNVSCGLFSYPALMAADILLYDADLVPVGEDQMQHLELTRDIAHSVNNRFQDKVFQVPEALLQAQCTRIKSLRDATKKMSKSDPSDQSRINLSDSAEIIRDKIKRAKTDSLDYISYDLSRPEIGNLLEIFSSLSGKTIMQVTEQYQVRSFSNFKTDLADLLVETLAPIREEYLKLLNDKRFIEQILKDGSDRAAGYSGLTIKRVKEKFGFVNS